MKRYISCLLTLALLVPAFVSCTKEIQDDSIQKDKNTHLVYFSTSNPETKTGLTIENGMANPDWRKTELDNLHFFEMPVNGGEPAYGEALSIMASDDNITANFLASFSEDMTIIVDPSSTKAGGSENDKYYYGAVVAQMPGDDLTFVIPAEQEPDAETLKDPDADFLIGYSRKACDVYVDDENVVDLYFDRVAALGRLSFTKFKGTNEKVNSVTINSSAGLVGSAAYSAITFGDKNEVTFTRTAGPLTLSYGDGMTIPTEGAFEAYFVAIPGEATITSIEVLTDKYKYTKEIAGGKKFEFSKDQFKNINVDLSDATVEEVTSVWYKASVLENGIDYIIVSQGMMLNNGADGLTGEDAPTDNNGIITFDSTPAASVIWTAATLSGLEEFGHFTLSNGGKYLYRYSQESTQYMAIGDLPQAPTKHYVWDFDGTYLYHVSSASDNRNFYCYYSNEWTTDYTKSNAKPVTIYTTRAPQELSFDKESVEYDFDAGGEFEEPTLSAAGGTIYGAVTYSSDNTDVATVDSESGAVTIVKAGTAIITATAAGNAEYQAATASYTIVANTAALQTWYKAEEVENNGIYMVVSNGNALNLNGTSISTVSNNAFSGASFQYDADDNLKWTATVSDGKFTLKSGSRYLSRSSGNIQTSSSSGASLSYDSENDYITTSGYSGTYYIYYDSGWKASTTKNTATLYSTTPPLTARNLKFTPETVTHDLATQGADVAEATLSGDKIDDVTYAVTSDPKGVVSEINATTGAITLTSGKTGTVVITASALRTDTYKAESVSYTLNVIDSSIPAKTYKKVTSSSDLEVDAQYILVYESGSLAFLPILEESGTSFSKSGDNKLDVTISDNTITTAELADYELTLRTGYYLYVESASRYLYPYTTDSGRTTALNAESSPEHALNITINSNGTAKISVGNDYLNYSTNNGGRFSSTTSTSPNPNVSLYKLDDGSVTPPTPQKQDRGLTFGTTSFSCTLGQSATFPTLSGVTDGVTYTSSDESVATVNASGVVTTKAAGTTTIKAEAAEDDNYLAGSAQYTLTVNPAAQSSTYVLIPSSMGVISGKIYLIVSADASNYNSADHKKAFAGDEDGTAGDVSASNGTITGNYSDYEFTITKSGSNYTLLGPNGYVTGNSSTSYSRYIQVSSSEVTMSLATASELSAATSGDGKVADAFYFYYTKNSSKEVLYYNSDKAFKIGGSGRKYGVYLYMKYNGEQLAQNLSFNQTAVTVSQNQTFTKPTLSGVMTSVSYSSDNASVAEVDSSNGDVTINGVGIAHITASATSGTVGGINYGSGSAQYTLTVTEASAEKYYVLVTSEPASWDGKYLIVNTANDGTGSALNGTSTANVTISGGKILSTSTVDGYAMTVTSAGEVHPNQTDSSQGLIAYDITFSDGDWLYWYSSKYKQTSETLSTRHNKCTLYYNNGGVRLMSAGYNVNLSGGSITAPSKNYLYYQSSGSFTMSSSHADDRVQLYKLEENP